MYDDLQFDLLLHRESTQVLLPSFVSFFPQLISEFLAKLSQFIY